MIDLHCHILPGIDDGPADWDEAVDLARVAFEDGIRTIVATPHVSGEQEFTPQTVRALNDELNHRLRAEGIAVDVVPGAELMLVSAEAATRRWAINGSAYLLVEFPVSHLPAQAPEWVFRARAAGLIPIVAHPERNPSVLRDPARVLDLVAAGGLVQLTAASLADPSDREVRACARYLLGKGCVHFLATDAHSAGWRPPVLSGGLRVAVDLVGEERARRLVQAHPEAVVRGNPIDG